MAMDKIRAVFTIFIIGPICMIVEVIGEVVMPKMLALIIDYGAGAGQACRHSESIRYIRYKLRFVLAI